ncbi:MAG: substrate-binding domain-containing protein [Burkholderiaceae bacterium]
MRRQLITLLATLTSLGLTAGLFAAAAFAAPPRAALDKPNSTSANVRRIGLITPSLTSPFFKAIEQGAQAAAQEFGLKLEVRGLAQEYSVEQQIDQVKAMTDAKVDAIVIAPIDSKRLVPELNKASVAGLRIIIVDDPLDPEALRQAGMAPPPFIGVDNQKAAHAAARALIEDVKMPTEAAILEGVRGADNAIKRLAGAKKALGEHPSIRLVTTESANWREDQGYDTAKKIFARHPQVKLVFASNDAMALGVLKFLQDTRRTDVRVGGYDALPEALAQIKAGRLAVTVDQQAERQGYLGVTYALRLLEGKPVPAVELIESRLITADRLR